MDISFTGLQELATRAYPRTGKIYGSKYHDIVEEISFVVNDAGRRDLADLHEAGFFDKFASKKGEDVITLRYSKDPDTNAFDTHPYDEFETINGKKITKKSKSLVNKLVEILEQHNAESKKAVMDLEFYEKLGIMTRLMKKKIRLIDRKGDLLDLAHQPKPLEEIID